MDPDRPASPTRSTYAALLLLSLSVLIFEIIQTRLFSVAQFYHFAFMIVSLALLGSGASGTLLAIFPTLGRARPQASLAWLALLAGLSMIFSYLLANALPFDSFSMAWDRRQAARLVAHYVALALPFFFSGMAASLLLESYPLARGRTYAVNMVGSALGCAVSLILPALAGGVGTLTLSSGLSAAAALIGLSAARQSGRPRPAPARPRCRAQRLALVLLCAGLLAFALVDAGSRIAARPALAFLELKISPYKGLSYALQYPGAEVTHSAWNAFSRIDLVSSPGIRSFAGMSYLYLDPLPAQDAIFVDGDDPSPVVRGGAGLDFVPYMPSAVAFALRPAAGTLVLEPRGGLDLLIARRSGAGKITAVEVNPLVIQAAPSAYQSPGTETVVESGRSYLQHATQRFDVILLSMTGAYHPVQSGAYSLAEDYRYTVEAFQEALQRLNPQGILVMTRWLQTPPSEELRAFATSVTAVERMQGSPRDQIVAFRGYNTLTLLVKSSPFTPAELATIRQFTASRAFDLVWAAGIRPEETNQYNVLPQPVYYQTFKRLLETQPREAFYADYPYDVRPATDDHPFFGHFFKWSQAGEILANLGRTWQPFGGAGYLVILALLAVAVVSSTALILLPVALARETGGGAAQPQAKTSLALPAYFAFIGFAYLLVEMPLIQRFILFLGHPTYAMAAVLFSLLLFSGLGSRWSDRLPLKLTLAALALLLLAMPLLLQPVFRLALGLSLPLRLALTLVCLAPAGFLMGVPFPAGLRHFLREQDPSYRLPWIWSINGAASVSAAVLAALLALSLGFAWVLRIGALCYAAAWIMAAARAPLRPESPPR